MKKMIIVCCIITLLLASCSGVKWETSDSDKALLIQQFEQFNDAEFNRRLTYGFNKGYDYHYFYDDYYDLIQCIVTQNDSKYHKQLTISTNLFESYSIDMKRTEKIDYTTGTRTKEEFRTMYLEERFLSVSIDFDRLLEYKREVSYNGFYGGEESWKNHFIFEQNYVLSLVTDDGTIDINNITMVINTTEYDYSMSVVRIYGKEVGNFDNEIDFGWSKY